MRRRLGVAATDADERGIQPSRDVACEVASEMLARKVETIASIADAVDRLGTWQVGLPVVVGVSAWAMVTCRGGVVDPVPGAWACRSLPVYEALPRTRKTGSESCRSEGWRPRGSCPD